MAPLWTSTELRCSIIFPLYTVDAVVDWNFAQIGHKAGTLILTIGFCLSILPTCSLSCFFCNFPQKGGVPAYFTPDCLLPKVHARQLSQPGGVLSFTIIFSFLKHSSCMCWNGVYFKYENPSHICIYFVCHFNAKYFTQAAWVGNFIGLESDHWLPLAVTDSGFWRCQLKTSWCC